MCVEKKPVDHFPIEAGTLLAALVLSERWYIQLYLAWFLQIALLGT